MSGVGQSEASQPRFPLDELGREWVPEELRQHWIPGNRRQGTSPTPKRAFATVEEIEAFVAARPGLGGKRGVHFYRCAVCDQYHLARNYRHGDPRKAL